ncbi:VOC family protein [Sphingomonas sp. LaA6.9]|uniref:VOC family protein n=1 Tax=Sphingomonas sp. LaA6.9 TaxID=2919914 RepID=UPI001F4FF364|nr:VOC family protein [Sphingomonas sp. LaA6.9]MCJ8157390.1 VOC family protein [Sphingomonas sp. LaA6.9]
MTTDLHANTTTAYVPERRQTPHPREYAHIVLKTARTKDMIAWYCKALGMSVVLETPFISFLTWDDSQDRLALIEVPQAAAMRGPQSNLHHVAFTYDRLADTVSVYRALKAEGIEPHWCVNHGVATSFYYHDPDQNSVELSVENFPDRDTLNAWLRTGAFNRNPIGVTLDPDELAARVESGEPEASILQPHPEHGDLLQPELERIMRERQAQA